MPAGLERGGLRGADVIAGAGLVAVSGDGAALAVVGGGAITTGTGVVWTGGEMTTGAGGLSAGSSKRTGGGGSAEAGAGGKPG